MRNDPREIVELVLENGRSPFHDWFTGLRDIQAKRAVVRRFRQARGGNMGDVEPVGSGVFEFRFDVGPGYRIYFAEVMGRIVVLLAAGDKRSQQRDINRAIELWLQNRTRVMEDLEDDDSDEDESDEDESDTKSIRDVEE
jgi:putative addiction module killer protein